MAKKTVRIYKLTALGKSKASKIGVRALFLAGAELLVFLRKNPQGMSVADLVRKTSQRENIIRMNLSRFLRKKYVTSVSIRQ